MDCEDEEDLEERSRVEVLRRLKGVVGVMKQEEVLGDRTHHMKKDIRPKKQGDTRSKEEEEEDQGIRWKEEVDNLVGGCTVGRDQGERVHVDEGETTESESGSGSESERGVVLEVDTKTLELMSNLGVLHRGR